ncbi:TPA: hypothetical protein ACQ65G_000432 [Neisseria meningitidis]|uniref:hypothetical protein n=1 Tax=Neisseria TaxID=482 RepID=UPI00046DC19D|nr:hypothetical protein [Neisseria meningitidis]
MLGLTRDNCYDLGFAILCYECNAVNKDEFLDWLYGIVKTVPVESFPKYLIDLIDYLESEDSSLYIYNIIGFVPTTGMTKKEKDAVYGITYIRNQEFYDIPITREKALKALKKHPEIYQKFRHFFPFVELPPL